MNSDPTNSLFGTTSSVREQTVVFKSAVQHKLFYKLFFNLFCGFLRQGNSKSEIFTNPECNGNPLNILRLSETDDIKPETQYALSNNSNRQDKDLGLSA